MQRAHRLIEREGTTLLRMKARRRRRQRLTAVDASQHVPRNKTRQSERQTDRQTYRRGPGDGGKWFVRADRGASGHCPAGDRPCAAATNQSRKERRVKLSSCQHVARQWPLQAAAVVAESNNPARDLVGVMGCTTFE